MSRIYNFTNNAEIIKTASDPGQYRPQLQNYGLDNPVTDVLGTAAYLLSPISSLPTPLSAPLDIAQTVIINKFLNKIKEKKARKMSYKEGWEIGFNNPFIRMKSGDQNA
jgi:hypothetical protein